MRPGRAADHSPSSSAAVMEQYSYTSTHPLGHTGAVTGSLYLHVSYNTATCCDVCKSSSRSFSLCTLQLGDEIRENNSRIHLGQITERMDKLQSVKNNTNFGQITGMQEKLDTTCK